MPAHASVARLCRRKTPLFIFGGVILLGVGALAGGWYYSDSLKSGALEPNHDPEELDLEVAAVGEGRVTLRVTPDAKKDGDWTQDGIFGLEWNGGYGQVGAILEIDDRQVVRTYTPMQGSPDAGDAVRLDSFAFPGDPQRAFGIPFQEVTLASPLGDLPAWFVDGSRDTWAIFVHGRGASRREALRMLPTVTGLGLSSLVITYRNDEEAPRSPDGFYRFGQTEWEDLQAAVGYAIDHGASGLVLVGYSMGGAVVANFLYGSPLAGRVTAAILDSPMLDFGAAVDWGSRDSFAPWPLRAIGKTLAGLRFDIDWDATNYLKRGDELTVPILLFHGDADDRVPVKTSDALAKDRPDIVTYVRVPGAGHVRSWNTDPLAYEAAVRAFLTRVTR